jgi:hypothetical protein
VAGLSTRGANNPIAVDFDPKDNVVYWSDVGSSGIKRIRLNNSSEDELINLGAGESWRFTKRRNMPGI